MSLLLLLQSATVNSIAPIQVFEQLIDLGEDGHPTHALSSFQLQQLFYYDNKTYINWMKRNGVGYANENMVMWYDHVARSLSDSYSTGIVNASSADLHSHGSIFVTSTGRILVVRIDQNNTQFYLSYSDNGTSWTDTITIGSGQVHNYAQFQQFSNGDIYLWSRNGDDSNTNKYLKIYKSSNDGLTWDAGTRVVQLNASQRVYPGVNSINTNDELICVFSRRNDTLGGLTFPSNYVIRSTDGDTWENWEQTFSKQESVSGAITQAELEANCKSNGGTEALNTNRWCAASTLSSLGNIYLIQRNDATGFNFVYYDNGWQVKAVNISLKLTGDPFGLISISENDFVLYAVSASDELIKISTSNKGDSWALDETIRSDVYSRAAIPTNYSNKGLVATIDGDGTGTSSNIYVKEL
jgi:hypothetical protein